MNQHQKEVYEALKKSGKPMTLEEIYEEVTFSYYYNWKKHLGNVMSTAVKAGRVERIKCGVFKLKSPDNTKQGDLFKQ